MYFYCYCKYVYVHCSRKISLFSNKLFKRKKWLSRIKDKSKRITVFPSPFHKKLSSPSPTPSPQPPSFSPGKSWREGNGFVFIIFARQDLCPQLFMGICVLQYIASFNLAHTHTHTQIHIYVKYYIIHRTRSMYRNTRQKREKLYLYLLYFTCYLFINLNRPGPKRYTACPVAPPVSNLATALFSFWRFPRGSKLRSRPSKTLRITPMLLLLL